jgi:hypothetical protein
MIAPKEFELHINLNLGKFGAVMYATDLTEEYVDFNKGDVTDASSLGGSNYARVKFIWTRAVGKG